MGFLPYPDQAIDNSIVVYADDWIPSYIIVSPAAPGQAVTPPFNDLVGNILQNFCVRYFADMQLAFGVENPDKCYPFTHTNSIIPHPGCVTGQVLEDSSALPVVADLPEWGEDPRMTYWICSTFDARRCGTVVYSITAHAPVEYDQELGGFVSPFGGVFDLYPVGTGENCFMITKQEWTIRTWGYVPPAIPMGAGIRPPIELFAATLFAAAMGAQVFTRRKRI